MNLINTKTFEIKENVSTNFTELKDIARLNPDIVLWSGETFLYPAMYIKDLTIDTDKDPYEYGGRRYNWIKVINNMSQAEKDAKNAELADKERRNSFLGFNIKMSVDFYYAQQNLKPLVDECVSDDNIYVKTKKEELKDGEGYTTDIKKTTTVLLDKIRQSDYDDIKPLITGGVIVVDTIDGDGIEATEGDKKKYIIPNKVTT